MSSPWSCFFGRLFLASFAGLAFFAPVYAKPLVSSIVVDARTGRVLHAYRPDKSHYPASITKVMTLYLLFEAIERGKVKMTQKMRVSYKASRQVPSKLGLKPGSSIRVKDAIMSLVTKSANDVAVVIAEHLAKTERIFALRMTAKARKLGMRKTVFKNASGLHHPAQMTTARDLAVLGQAIQKHFPNFYRYFKTRSFKFKGRRYANHNKLLGKVRGVDGIKTGYTSASGYNLLTSARADNRQIIITTLGAKSARVRNRRVTQLVQKNMPKAYAGNFLPKERLIPVKRLDGAVFQLASNKSSVLLGFEKPLRRPVSRGGASKVPLAPRRIFKSLPPLPTHKSSEVKSVKMVSSREMKRRYDGWVVQISATPYMKKGLELLEKARLKRPELFQNLEPVVEKVIKIGRKPLYRVRVAGFRKRRDASSACSTLRRSGFACIAQPL